MENLRLKSTCKKIIGLFIIGIIITDVFYLKDNGYFNQIVKQASSLGADLKTETGDLIDDNNVTIADNWDAKQDHTKTLAAAITNDDNMPRSLTDNITSICEANPCIKDIRAPPKVGYFYPGDSLYYCHVPKLGSMFLTQLFYKVIGKSKRITYFPHSEFSYLNVGEPYARLFSAYKDKLYRPNVQFWRALGRPIAKHVRREKPNSQSGSDITFPEMIQYVVDLYEKGIPLNVHLEPIHKLCNPCKVRFNFVSRQESLSKDVVDLIHRLNTSRKDGNKIPASVLDATGKPDGVYKSVEKLEGAVKDFPKFSKYDVLLRHWSMYQMSGHILKKYEMPYDNLTSETISYEDYKENLLQTIQLSKQEDATGELMLQRYESMLEAYRSVPMALMERLRNFVKIDCLLFSYDDRPDYLFDRSMYNETLAHRYLKGI